MQNINKWARFLYSNFPPQLVVGSQWNCCCKDAPSWRRKTGSVCSSSSSSVCNSTRLYASCSPPVQAGVFSSSFHHLNLETSLGDIGWQRVKCPLTFCCQFGKRWFVEWRILKAERYLCCRRWASNLVDAGFSKHSVCKWPSFIATYCVASFL